MHHKRPTPVILAAVISLAFLLTLSACFPFIKKAPPANQIFTESTDFAFRIDLADIPIDWAAFEAKKDSLKARMNKQDGYEFTEILEDLNLDQNKVLAIAGCTYGLADYLAMDEEDRNEPPEFVVVLDADRKISVETLVTKLNNDKKLDSTATVTGKEKGFDLVKLIHNSGQYHFTVALFTGRQSQIRIGTDAAILSSLSNPTDYTLVREDMLRPDGQSWAYMKIPEELNENLSQYESLLPFEAGVLVSGFKTLVYSLETTEASLDSTISLEFDSEEQANTAFSYLQLGLNFALKPYLRKKTQGESAHFIRSIKNENAGDLVKLSCSINGEDIDTIQRLFDELNIPVEFLPFLDLIKQP